MFDNFVQKGILSQEEVTDIKKKVSETNNISFDKNVDYVETFKECDLLVSDFTSMLIELFSLRKPIIYCGETDNFNSVGLRMNHGLYHAADWNSLELTLNNLFSGEDTLRGVYDNSATELIGSDSSIAEGICSEILKDFNWF